MTYLLYNPTANSGNQTPRYEALAEIKKIYTEITEIDFTSLKFDAFVDTVKFSDTVVLVGGDGTLNKFANLFKRSKLNCKLLYFAGGTGNDFLNDIDNPKGLVELNQYLNTLPIVNVNGNEYYFLNNSSYGMDGMVCQIADDLKQKGKKYNYTTISAKLLLYKYRKCNATVTIDGEAKEYKKVWLATTMFGRYLGGGMKMCPEQDRKKQELSAVVFHGGLRLWIILIFLSIFKGKHTKHKSIITIKKGQRVHVEFDESRPMQIDGEVIRDVKEYDVYFK